MPATTTDRPNLCEIIYSTPSLVGRAGVYNFSPTDPAMRGGGAKGQVDPLLKYTNDKRTKRNNNEIIDVLA